jgi:hypothetical protein
MSSMTWPFTDDTAPRRTTSEVIRTHAERLALEEHARAEKKRLDVAEQRSDQNPAEVRIRAWEKVHGLSLPSDPTHPILDVIAVCTRLTLAEVQEVQRKHAAQRAARAAKQKS